MITKERIAAAVRAAAATKGPHKGQLLSKMPSYREPDAQAAWLALMLDANPFKAGIGAIMMLTAEQRALFDELRAIIDTRKIDVRGLDRDRVALEAWGAW